MKYTTLTIFAICYFSTFLIGQTFKYGKVSKDLMTLEKCDFSPDADAMITYYSGDQNFAIGSNILTIRKVKTQLKIFNSKAKDMGTFKFVFYSPKGGTLKTRVKDVKGITYNFINNVISKTKLEDQHIVITQKDNYYKEVSIAFPNVQNNSVLEWEYEIHSDFFTSIDDWLIQADIPILYNTFSAQFPNSFTYQTLLKGNQNPTKSDDLYGTLNYVFEHVKPYEIEPFNDNYIDQISKLTFQLVRYEVPGVHLQTFASDFTEINKELLESENFGSVIKNGDFIKDQLKITQEKDTMEIAKKIYDHFVSSIKWDEYLDFTTDVSGKKLFAKGSGSTSDINLNYIAALNEMGIPTSGVIFKTRGYGVLLPFYPNYSDFNTVVALSKINGKEILSDVTSGLPFGFLPVRCLNGRAWNVNHPIGKFLDLKQRYAGKTIYHTEAVIENDKIVYKTATAKYHYSAFDDLHKITTSGKENFKHNDYDHPSLNLDSIEITEIKADQVKILEYHSLEENLSEDILYVQPFPKLPMQENPFKREKRESQIDLPYIFDYKIISNLKIPAGYTFEAPEKINVSLEDNSIVFVYNYSLVQAQNILNIKADFKISRPEFTPSEYLEIKSIFDMFINKINEKIVVKKLP